jgi:sirohydrochlorin cobaltochelatase
MTRAIILFGHGSRDPLWRQPMDAVAARLAARDPALLVRCAFLELMGPDLTTAATELASLGAGQVDIVPLFLGVGRHVREDLPALADQLRRSLPQVQWTLRAPVGEDPRLLDLLADLAWTDAGKPGSR